MGYAAARQERQTEAEIAYNFPIEAMHPVLACPEGRK